MSGVTAFALGPLLSRSLFLVPVFALACVLSLRRLLLLLLLQLPQAAGVAEAAAHVRVRGEQAGCRSQRRARRSRCCARRSCCFARPRVVRHRCVPRGWPPGAGAACSWRVLLSCCTCPRPALLCVAVVRLRVAFCCAAAFAVVALAAVVSAAVSTDEGSSGLLLCLCLCLRFLVRGMVPVRCASAAQGRAACCCYSLLFWAETRVDLIQVFNERAPTASLNNAWPVRAYVLFVRVDPSVPKCAQDLLAVRDSLTAAGSFCCYPAG